MRKWLFILALAIGILLIIYGLGLLSQPKPPGHLPELPKSGEEKTSRGQQIISKPQEGFSAPDFTLTNLKGETIKLSELRGKPVFLNFWATWCPPCRAEMPLIQNLYQEKGSQLQILTINIQEDPQTIEKFLRKNHYNFPVLLDKQGQVANQYWIKGIPTTFIIDQQGIIRAVWVGALEEKDLKALLAKIDKK